MKFKTLIINICQMENIATGWLTTGEMKPEVKRRFAAL